MQEERPQAGFTEWLLEALFGGPRAMTVEDTRVGLSFVVRRPLFRNLHHHSRKFAIGQIDDWVCNPTCTAENCGAEVVRLIPAAGTFGVTEKCPGCLRKIPLVESEPSKHARHEVHVPLPKLKRAVFSALRELKKKGVSFQGRIDIDLMSALEQLAL